MPGTRTRILLILAVTAILVVGAAVAAVLLLPAERVAALAARRAEAAIGRDVRIDGASIDLFPAPAVVLEGVAVGREGSGDTPPLATVRRVVLRPLLLPLLQRRVVIDAIILERPLLLVEVDREPGSGIPEPPERAVDAAGTDEGEALAFAVRSFEVENGRVAYINHATGAAVRLNGVGQRLELSGAVSDGELVRVQATGELDVEAVDADLPGQLALPIRGLPLHLAHDAILDRREDRLEIERLALRLGDVELEGAGVVRALSDSAAREVELRLATGVLDVEDLIGSLAAVLGASGRVAGTAGDVAAGSVRQPEGEAELPEVSGQVRLSATVTGRFGGDSIPAVNGTLALSDVAVSYAGIDPLIEELQGDVSFSLDSLGSRGLTGRLLDEALRLEFHVEELAAPVARASVRTELDLARADALGLLPDSLDARGRATIDVAVRTPLMRPAQAELDGAIGLAGVVLEPAGLLVPVAVEEGRALLRGQELRGDGIRLRMGESDLAVDFTARDWLARALGDSSAVPRLSFDARSRFLDADALLGVDSVRYTPILFARLADRPIDGRTAAERAEAAGFTVPALPPVALEGRFRARTLQRSGLELHDVDITLAGRPGMLDVRNARFGLMGGSVQLSARAELPGAGEFGRADEAADAGYAMMLEFQLEDVGAAPFFDTFTQFREHLSGTLTLAGTTRLVLDRHMLPHRESVTAEGTIGVSGGELSNWTVLNALGAELGLAALDTLSIRDWAGRFDVAGPLVAIGESLLDSDELDAQIAGTFDLAGLLDLGATLRLAPELASRTGQEVLVRLANVAAGPDEDIPVGVRITGPVESPTVGLDLSAATGNLTAAARAAAEEEARELAERAAAEARELAERAAAEARDRTGGIGAEIMDRLLPGFLSPADSTAAADTLVGADSIAAPDSLAVRPDSTRGPIESELLERPRGLTGNH